MSIIEASKRQDYLDAYETWQTQLEALHRVLLDGERLEPPKLKALLNREARAKERYDQARRNLLGLSEEGKPGGESGPYP